MSPSPAPRLRFAPGPEWPLWPWGLLGLLAALDGLWLGLTPLSLDPGGYRRLAAFVAVILIGTWGAAAMADWPRLRALLAGGALMLVAWPVLRVLNHLTMTTGLPLADDALAAADAALGFDWLGYLAWADRDPGLLRAMDMSYAGLTSYSLLLYLLLILACRDPNRACSEFVQVFLLTAVACIAIGCGLPAVSAAVHFAPSPDLFAHIRPERGAYHLGALTRLRSDPAAVLTLGALPGLVTFPSFHTAMGVVAIYGARHRWWLLAGMVPVNLVMIASTPILGAHYGVDLLGGIAVAGAAILTARALAGQGAAWGSVALAPVR